MDKEKKGFVRFSKTDKRRKKKKDEEKGKETIVSVKFRARKINSECDILFRLKKVSSNKDRFSNERKRTRDGKVQGFKWHNPDCVEKALCTIFDRAKALLQKVVFS